MTLWFIISTLATWRVTKLLLFDAISMPFHLKLSDHVDATRTRKALLGALTIAATVLLIVLAVTVDTYSGWFAATAALAAAAFIPAVFPEFTEDLLSCPWCTSVWVAAWITGITADSLGLAPPLIFVWAAALAAVAATISVFMDAEPELNVEKADEGTSATPGS